MSFVEVIFGIILTVFSARNSVVTDTDRTRLHGIAQDIWTVSEAAEGKPFQCEKAKEAAALALVTIAYHESGFWEKVQDCSVCYRGSKWCGGGLAITLFQLEGDVARGGYTRAELCASNAKAAERALAVLGNYRRAGSVGAMFDGYARGGVGSVRSTPAIEMDQIFATFARRAEIRVGYRFGSLCAISAQITRTPAN